MKDKIKKYWFMLLSMVVVILDGGFDVINPMLVDLSIPPTVINVIKIIFVLYGIVRLARAKSIKIE